MDRNLLSLFQLCDSNFPTGAFSHSFGLETYIQNNHVKDEKSFLTWLNVYLNEQLIYCDGLACKVVYEALQKGDAELVWKMDRLLTVQNLPRETREGTQRIGERMLKLVKDLYPIPILSEYGDRVSKRQSFGHPSIVFTMIGHHLGIPNKTTTLFYLYSTIMSLVQNAVRAIPLGQTSGQKIIQQFQSSLVEATDKISNLTEDDFGIVSPGLELSQMNHERVNVRIFMS
ncbi:urease accessory protein UreF [Lederbergia wuyishanensis]|uniref:Urease accessory protein UreF n=1 Tax=Lederbergia wuyishanensis TaxID=1347903 RepID=A0ABU0D5G2_9BACI|nr:urease accessory protein UreF [Lederbergia wuyishanensis]MCJ8009774.1 urease accessory protein UreF [Lederbergia wuyishanensis]MDQ0343629.1 urease accessory protein [Lederbergia wuyishanensis]